MLIGKFAATCCLGHDPLGGRVTVVPAHVFHQVREQMEEPATRVSMDGVNAAERSALHNFFDLLVVLVVTVLVRNDSFYAGKVNCLANLHGLVHGKRHGFFIGDQLCPGKHPCPDQFEPDARGSAETKHIRPDFAGESEWVQRGQPNSKFGRRFCQLLRARIRQPDQLKTGVVLKAVGVVHAPLAGANNDDFVDFLGVHDCSLLDRLTSRIGHPTP